MKACNFFKPLLAATLLGSLSIASPPVVKTVPWVDGNPLIPHTTYPGKAIRVKGTCDQTGPNLHWTWDFGDGSSVASGTVSDRYAIEALHTYTGAVGTTYSARLTVVDTSTGDSDTKFYYVVMQAKSQDVEVNVAIDDGLWYLHKNLVRTTSYGYDSGYWNPSYVGLTAANVNAFEVNGHKETGSSANPYTETVTRGLRYIFASLTSRPIGLQSNPLGTFNPDSNLNGIGVFLNQGYPYYQGGMIIDAIVASGTPNAVTVTGPGNIINRSYNSIVQDMVDDIAWAQYDGNPGGGWRYNANEWPDNSVCQWSAIGLIAAERNWGATIPLLVKQWNIPWLKYSQAGNGSFGYTDYNSAWGPFATTPSGMVQMVMDGIGRGPVPSNYPSWDKAETFIRDNFGNGGGATSSIKSYYYGLFSFVKSMLLYPYDTDDDTDSDPNSIVMLKSQTPGVPPINWYAAEVSKGDPTDGVARTLINGQSSAGNWSGHNYTSDQYPFETAWAVMMLHRTLFESGVPVAVGKAVPNPAVAGQLIHLDASDSFHQDSHRMIVNWEWDLNSDGVYDTSGVTAYTSFGTVGNYPIKLRVTDNSTPPRVAETIATIVVDTPPLPPTADADGPYTFCSSTAKWFLNGLNSTNPDEGNSEPTRPGDTIHEYAWDLDGDQVFDDAFGPTPDVKAFFAGKAAGLYLVTLRVTDTTASSYPHSGMPDLTSFSTAEIRIVPQNDPDCACITLSATPALNGVQLQWSGYSGAHHYKVLRSITQGGPYLWVADVMSLVYLDEPGVLNRAYYYVVQPAQPNGDSLCQSNEASAEPLHPAPTVLVLTVTNSNLGRYYYQFRVDSKSFGDEQLQVFVGDTASSQVAGPYVDENIVRIRTGVPSVRPGTDSVVALITVAGQAKIWVKDPIGQTSAVTLLKP